MWPFWLWISFPKLHGTPLVLLFANHCQSLQSLNECQWHHSGVRPNAVRSAPPQPLTATGPACCHDQRATFYSKTTFSETFVYCVHPIRYFSSNFHDAGCLNPLNTTWATIFIKDWNYQTMTSCPITYVTKQIFQILYTECESLQFPH